MTPSPKFLVAASLSVAKGRLFAAYDCQVLGEARAGVYASALSIQWCKPPFGDPEVGEAFDVEGVARFLG